MSTLRRGLFVLVTVGLAGTLGELLLIPHTEEIWQWVPIVVTAIALGMTAWHAAAPGRRSRRLLLGALGLLAAAGVAGLWLHYAGNLEFEREISPGLGGFGRFWRAIRGTAPPSLAPGALIEFALLGALALWHDAPPVTPPRSGGPS